MYRNITQAFSISVITTFIKNNTDIKNEEFKNAHLTLPVVVAMAQEQ